MVWHGARKTGRVTGGFFGVVWKLQKLLTSLVVKEENELCMLYM